LHPAIQWRVGGVLFFAVLLLSAQALAAPQPAAQDVAGHGWPQTPASPSGIATPAIGSGQRLIRFNGRALDGAAQPVAGVAGVTFAIYEDQSGGAPLWQETQNLTTEADGRFSVLLGATSATGIPPELFVSGESRWLAVLTNAPGAAEQPRVLLVSVPFALRSADSEMLGGKPASAYLTANALAANPGSCAESGTATTESALRKAVAATIAASSPTLGYLPYFYDAGGDLKNSALYQSSNGYVGIGTSTPAALFSLAGVNPTARIENYSNTTGDSPNFNFYSGRGTAAKPLATLNGDSLGQFASAGYTGSAFPSSKVKVGFLATENWTTAANGTAMTFATTANGTTTRTERMRIDNNGNIGIGTATPSHTLSLGGGQGRSLAVEANPTAGGAGTNLSIAAGAPASGASNQAGGNLILEGGNGTGTGAGGNVQLQTAGSAANATAPDPISDRLLIVGKPKAMTGLVPTANLFSVHIAAGDAAGGRVKFTIVASDGKNYAAETGEIIYLAIATGAVSCGVVESEYTTAPPTWTNTALGITSSPNFQGGLGQTGWLNAQCSYTYFGSDLGFRIFDTQPTWFTPTTHKVYYSIENQSQSAITLQP
jgi:hypothetical protein